MLLFQASLLDSSKAQVDEICSSAASLFELCLSYLPIVYGKDVYYHFENNVNHRSLILLDKSTLKEKTYYIKCSKILPQVHLIVNNLNYQGPFLPSNMCSDDGGCYVSSKITKNEVFEVTVSPNFGAVMMETFSVILPEKMRLILKSVLVFFSTKPFPIKPPFYSNNECLNLTHEKWLNGEESDLPDLYLSYNTETINVPVSPFHKQHLLKRNIPEAKPVYYITLKFILRETISYGEMFTVSVEQVRVSGKPYVHPNSILASDFQHCVNFFDKGEQTFLEEPNTIENILLYIKMGRYSESLSKMMVFRLKFLEEIDLSQVKTRLIDQESLHLISTNCLNLTKLNLSNLKSVIDDNFLLQLSQNCKKIQEISLYNCEKITSLSFSKFLLNCSDLIKLDISFCTQLDTKCLELISKFSTLQSLSISDLAYVNDNILLSYVENLVNLTELDISYCHSLSTLSISKIGTEQPNLKVLNFHGVKAINDACAFEVVSNCSNLVDIDLSSCFEIDLPDFKIIMSEMRPGLNVKIGDWF
eukprot:TRINITY_DN15372_c0_g1_i1.p1 TRINITY_DN15372_c0_g1~~TRINITY_DN15372_c0_g1_i1.p1  ORF type:complete len:531 (-),score=119.11 TRINITY_DN15372_c0_g1_i1:54-1646(-)